MCFDGETVNRFEISCRPISLIFSVQQVVDLHPALPQRHPDEGQPLGRGLDDAAQAGDVLEGEPLPDRLVDAQDFEQVTIGVAQTELKLGIQKQKFKLEGPHFIIII